MLRLLSVISRPVIITSFDLNVFYILLGGIIALLGWIGRNQIKWMHQIEDKVNRLQMDNVAIKTILGIKESHTPE